jgi:hypothetical protein
MVDNVPIISGNHDDDSNMKSRKNIIEYIMNMEYTLTQLGPYDTTHTAGNYYLDIFETESSTDPTFRTWHLDSDTQGESITTAQVLIQMARVCDS